VRDIAYHADDQREAAGYASSKELNNIADELEKMNKLCREHRIY
jgi:hypothetical protein